MKRIALSVLVILAIATVTSLTGCAGRQLNKRVDKLETLFENSEVLQKEIANMATTTGLKVDKMEKEFKKLYSLTAQIGDQINFIPEEAMETEPANSNSAEPTPKAKAKTSPPASLEGKLAALAKRVGVHEKRLNRHDSRFSDLRRRLAEAEDEISPVYLWTAPFKTNSAKLTKAHKEGLDKLAIEILAGRVEIISAVVGYADPRGSKEDNKKLSKERAQSCIDYLVEKLGANKSVKWLPGQKWQEYFTALAGGETARYGNFQYSRRVQFKKS